MPSSTMHPTRRKQPPELLTVASAAIAGVNLILVPPLGIAPKPSVLQTDVQTIYTKTA
jgi:hypothetical protein